MPGMHGVDTRSLTKRIRQQGSMLGRMLLSNEEVPDGAIEVSASDKDSWRSSFQQIEWENPNSKNLVSEGKLKRSFLARVEK